MRTEGKYSYEGYPSLLRSRLAGHTVFQILSTYMRNKHENRQGVMPPNEKLCVVLPPKGIINLEIYIRK